MGKEVKALHSRSPSFTDRTSSGRAIEFYHVMTLCRVKCDNTKCG